MRVEPYIIARRYTYEAAENPSQPLLVPPVIDFAVTF